MNVLSKEDALSIRKTLDFPLVRTLRSEALISVLWSFWVLGVRYFQGVHANKAPETEERAHHSHPMEANRITPTTSKRKRNGPGSAGVQAQAGKIATLFNALSTQYDERNNRRETIYRQTRELTIQSKRMIFTLHRFRPLEKNEKLLKDGEIAATKLYQIVQNIHGMLEDEDDYWRMLPKISFGLQEFIEAVSFLHYIKTKEIIKCSEIESRINLLHDMTKTGENKKDDLDSDKMEVESKTKLTWKFRVTLEDYLLGIADTTGEMMRLATTCAGAGDQKSPMEILKLVRDLYSILLPVTVRSREWGKKLEVMLASLKKIERLCYKLHIQGREYPPHLLKKILSSTSNSEYNDNDV
eukprot:jgi/Bigna1/129463/aug1.9_g4171